MIDLKDEQIKDVSGGELICSESGLLYFKQDDKNMIRFYVVLEGSDEDFEKMTQPVQERF
jgi:hypothetical protein